MNPNRKLPTFRKTITTLSILLFLSSYSFSQNIAITDDDGYNANQSAMLDVKSTTKGMLVPRVTTIQRNTISSPANGLLVFDTDLENFYFYNNSTWINLSSGNPSGLWGQNGNKIFLNDTTYNLGIGTHTPEGKLEVKADGTTSNTDPIFGVINYNGDTVFAVYPQGVRILVDDDTTSIKAAGSKSGFAVGGFSLTKGTTQEYLRVTPDSVRVYIDDDYTPNKASASKGGFAVGGFSLTKGIPTDNYFFVQDDSTRVYVADSLQGFGVENIEGTGNDRIMKLTTENYFIGHESGLSNLSGLYNSYFGYQAGKSGTTGSSNIAVGYQSGLNNNGNENIFVGYQAGNNSSNNQNTIVGYQSGFNNTGTANSIYGYKSGYSNSFHNNVLIGFECGFNNSGGDNVFIGYQCGYNNTSGNNVFVGMKSGFSNTSGSNNVFIGFQSGLSNTTAFANTFIGQSCGYSNTSGTNNIFIGETAGYKNQIQSANIFIGRDAGYENLNGYGNTYIGHVAAEKMVSGSGNLILGTNAGQNKTGGDNNVLLGVYAGGNNATGANNTFVGPYSGQFSSGSYNVFLGYQAGYSEAGSNKLYISNSSDATPLIYGDFSSDRININGSLQVTQTLFDDDGDAGNNGQVLSSTGPGTDWVDLPSGVSGSGVSGHVAFWTSANILSSNANLFWDYTNHRLGIGTYSPAYNLHSNYALLFGENTSASNKTAIYGIAVGDTDGADERIFGVYGKAQNSSSNYDHGYGVVGQSSTAFYGGIGVFATLESSIPSLVLDAALVARYNSSAYANLGYFSGIAYAGYFQGAVHVNGTLSKSAGTFKIDHPQDPENKYLIHSFVESPDMKNVYDGTATLDNQGNATIELPSYFEALNENFRYQLTSIGAFAPVYIEQEISNNQFIIAGGTPGMKVSWQITGIRKDPYAQQNPIVVEQEKLPEHKGKYLNPELYNQPTEKSIHSANAK